MLIGRLSGGLDEAVGQDNDRCSIQGLVQDWTSIKPAVRFHADR
jgi:hypothetical protein